ncbi:hypothetical protein M378DRAFT_166633 [Amanita muscaria Koide BX008]|uniref:Uncharacterized protein n=1 Tax=Amanita muscaria (strain Koide BX008) TaxID=946122 RepID=A0A0C2WZ32_AMAMK|nr:hypothetical protein M378DRAFT_166633 [Amanita muscaria Koide BX008]
MRDDGVPVWGRPLARALEGMGEETFVHRAFVSRLSGFRYTKNTDHISFVSDLPAHA